MFKEKIKKKIFFWCGIRLFDSRSKKYGGFNYFISRKIFKWLYGYIEISITYKFKFKVHKSDILYYDGYHNFIHMGFIKIDYCQKNL